MRRLLMLALALLALSACAAPADTEEKPAPPPRETPEAAAPEEVSPVPTEDRVLLTLDAPLADGRTLRLEAVGKNVDEYSAGVREVRVCDGEELLQTILSREAIEAEWGEGMAEDFYDYTECWVPEETMEALDLNFDGNADFGLFGWRCNNMIPYYYWTWDPESEQYRFACILQGADAHPETGETTAEYKSGTAGSQWITEHYRPDKNGDLYLVRWERLTRDFQPDSGYLDVDREGAREIWIPKEGNLLRPRPNQEWTEEDLVLTRREVPVTEIHGETASHFTEIWERKDGELQMTSREEYFYEEQPE